MTCQANGGRVGGPDGAHSSHPSQGKALNLLTSASALCGFFASVFESVAPTNQQHEMACSRNNVVLISKKKKKEENAVKGSPGDAAQINRVSSGLQYECFLPERDLAD